MVDTVVVCNGCCCGRVEKGHSEVPVDLLKDAWHKYGLEDDVKLTISDCLGPCSMHNVSLLKTSHGHTWLGKLSENEHFEALIEWALTVSSDGDSAELPELLEAHRFVRDESNP